VVGDRLDTDIEGANAVGCASLLVLSGVTGARDLLEAGPRLRPSYLGRDVSALLTAHPQPARDGDLTRCGRWHVRVENAAFVLGSGESGADDSGDGLDPLRALCSAAWANKRSNDAGWTCRGGDAQAQDALAGLGLDR
jgi:hypothetical protein